MTCVGARLLFLLVLFPPALVVEAETLSGIIRYLKQYGTNNQYALAINVDARYCQQNTPLDQNFLSLDHPNVVGRHLATRERIYRGHQLIVAEPKKIPQTWPADFYHSEYRLLHSSMTPALERYDPLMRNILNLDRNGCAIFFTLISPCVARCSTPDGMYNIIDDLNMFRNHNNATKMFVFQNIWNVDQNTLEWRDNIKHINNRVPVYRCTDRAGCTRCVSNNNFVLNRCWRRQN